MMIHSKCIGTLIQVIIMSHFFIKHLDWVNLAYEYLYLYILYLIGRTNLKTWPNNFSCRKHNQNDCCLRLNCKTRSWQQQGFHLASLKDQSWNFYFVYEVNSIPKKMDENKIFVDSWSCSFSEMRYS